MIQLDVKTRGLGPIQKELQRLADKTGDLTPALQEIGSSLETSTQQRFIDEVTPEGEAWVDHSDATIEARGSGAEKLRKDGHLLDSLGSQVSGDKAEVGVNRVYGRIQQLGGMAGRGLKVEIPARPYLGVSRDDEREIADIISDHLGAAA